MTTYNNFKINCFKTSLKLNCFLFAFAISLQSCGNAKKEQDEGNEEKIDSVFTPLYVEENLKTSEGFKAFVLDSLSSSSDCAKPSQDDVLTGKFEFYNYSCSKTVAAKAGIPIASMNASYNHKMFVQDFKRYKTCTTADGVTHQYGQVVRAVIEVTNYDASFGGSFSALAISGSTKGMESSIYIYSNGIDNTDLIPVLNSVSGKPFNVDTYKDYGGVLTRINQILVDKKTKFSVEEIGVEITKEEDERITYAKSPVITAALYAIKNKMSYNDLINKDFSKDKSAQEIIKDVYNYIGIPPNNTVPTERNILDAKDYLRGVKIRN